MLTRKPFTLVFLACAWAALGCEPPGPDADASVDAGSTPDAAADAGESCADWVCKNGQHIDPVLCECVPDACPPNLVCKNGQHLDPLTCECVPDPCPTNVVCKGDQHWDSVICACVPN